MPSRASGALGGRRSTRERGASPRVFALGSGCATRGAADFSFRSDTGFRAGAEAAFRDDFATAGGGDLSGREDAVFARVFGFLAAPIYLRPFCGFFDSRLSR